MATYCRTLLGFTVAAHHIAHLGGEVEKKILALVSLWLPDMP
jgi:hypothetical protein